MEYGETPPLSKLALIPSGYLGHIQLRHESIAIGTKNVTSVKSDDFLIMRQ